MLNFASNELSDLRENNNSFDFVSHSKQSKPSRIKILAEKICVPQVSEEETSIVVRRPRLFAHLEKSLAHFSATLLTGRTGTGKTALAAEFARHVAQKEDASRVAWYKTETTDGEWKVFLSYFAESLLAAAANDCEALRPNHIDAPVFVDKESVTDALAAQFAALDEEKPLLIVLDDLHSVFDADWFAEFFNALLSLPAPNVRLLMLARSQPSFPLWRLRSKHALDVMDEKLLAFTPEETVEFFRNYSLSQNAAQFAHKSAYGRIAKIKEIAEKKRTKK